MAVAIGLPSAAVVQADTSAVGRPRDGVRLILVVVVDQLGRDRFQSQLPGGLGRIAREGRVFEDAALRHAVTATCPGHVVLLTGRQPGPAGVPGNSFVERATGQSHYCVEDLAPDAAVFGLAASPGKGRSPRAIRVESFATWLKQQSPGSRVMSVSGKDRAAIASVGRDADGAWWFQNPVGFTTSRYYREALPSWVRAWNGDDPATDGLLRDIPESWVHLSDEPGPYGRKDDMHGEDTTRSRVSGHPLRASELGAFMENVYRSPYLDQLTLDFAGELVRREDLGRGPAPDLLVVSLSANDTVGHGYGPESHEARDTLARLDAQLGRFLTELEGRVGSSGLFVVLTADHGALPLPEWLSETGRSHCGVRGGRQPVERIGLGLEVEAHLKLGPVLSTPRRWFRADASGLTIDRAVATSRDIALEHVARLGKEYLESYDAIAHVWTDDEILHGESEMAQLYRNSFDPERSPDLSIEVAETCLLRSADYGTTHGSPHLYDRAIPLAFMGPGVAPGSVPGSAASVDIAPTLARYLGIAIPGGLDGRVLRLSGRENAAPAP